MPREGQPMSHVSLSRELCDFIEKSPTAFHAVASIAGELSAAGFVRLAEADTWEVTPGTSAFVTRNGSSIVAVRVGEKVTPDDLRFQMAAAHTDSPTFKVKHVPELMPQFSERGAVILGVSKDSVKSHKRFEEKYDLPFTILSDPELVALQAYDVWKEKKLYGKVSMGVVRTTYLIDEGGVIVRAHDKVKAADNPQQMLEELM